MPRRIGHALALDPSQLPFFSRSLGQSLQPAVRYRMEKLLEADFSDVKIHQGPEARSLGAQAFTCGTDIHFAPGLYNPSTKHGLRLLAHELTHVVQQKAGRVPNPFGQGLAVVQDPALEAEADRMGHLAASPPVSPSPQHPALGIAETAPKSAALQPATIAPSALTVQCDGRFIGDQQGVPLDVRVWALLQLDLVSFLRTMKVSRRERELIRTTLDQQLRRRGIAFDFFQLLMRWIRLEQRRQIPMIHHLRTLSRHNHYLVTFKDSILWALGTINGYAEQVGKRRRNRGKPRIRFASLEQLVQVVKALVSLRGRREPLKAYLGMLETRRAEGARRLMHYESADKWKVRRVRDRQVEMCTAWLTHMETMVRSHGKEGGSGSRRIEDQTARLVYTPTGTETDIRTCAAVVQTGGTWVFATNGNNPPPPEARDRLNSSLTAWQHRTSGTSRGSHHCEIKLWELFGDQAEYIGVQQLCCLLCAAQLLAVGYTSFRGCHMSVYSAGYDFSTKIINNSMQLAALMGPVAWSWFSELNPRDQRTFLSHAERGGLFSAGSPFTKVEDSVAAVSTSTRPTKRSKTESKTQE